MKHAAILIALVLLLALAGCSGAAPSPVVQVTPAPTEAPTEEPTQAPAVEQPDQAASEEKGQFDYNIIDAAQLPVTFPFKEVASHVVVDVAFGDDAPLPFMFDTGASTFVTQDIANVHGGDVLGQVPSEAGGGQMMMNDLQAYPSVMVGDSVEIRDMFALAPWDVANNTLYCVTPYGLLGSSALYQAVWQIDYGTNEITAAASVDQLDHIDGAMVLDFTPQEGLSPTPFVELPVGNGTLKFLVDTGGGLSIAINPADAASVGIEAPEDAPTISSRASGAAGSFDITRKVVNVPITLGDREITYPVTINEGMAPGAAGNIGHDFLKNFVVTFDWSTNKIYLDPIAEDGSVSAPKPPLDAGLGWDGQHVVVNGIVKGSAAAEAGLVGGEVVTNVNGESVEGFTLADFCDLANAGGVEAVTTEDGNTHPVNRVEDFYEGAGAPAAETSMAESEDAAAGSTFGEAWESVDCASIDVAPTVAAIADCGYVTVSANRANGSDQIIKLAVARVHSPSESPGAPVFLATGGPGGYGFGSIQTALDATNWPQSYATVLADRDWVFFTQRGTPGAKPELMCPAFDALKVDAAQNNWTEDEVIAELTERLQACYDTLVEAGVYFPDYNSVENAEDVNDIRQALGYDKIVMYGESYGTQLSQFVMRQHPEILEAVVLDGVVPVEFTTFAETQDTTSGFKRVLDACKADTECNSAYPDLENVLVQVYDALDANPTAVQSEIDGNSETLHVNGFAVLDALFRDAYGGGANVPHLIYSLKDNDLATLTSLAPSYSALNKSARMMNYAVNCSDDPSTSADEFIQEGVLPMYAAFRLDDAQKYQLVPCKIVDVPQLPDSSDAPITADIPTLVINGRLDPATPASNGDLVASHLPDVKEVTFGNGGHIQLSKLCAQSIIAAFLKDPSAQLDTSCVPDKQSFSLPFAATGASPDGNVSLTVTLPPDFIQVDPSSAQWQRPAGTPIFAINVEPAGTTALEALQKGLAKLGISPGEADIKDGPEIAGLPSKHYQGTKTLGDKEYALDAYGIANENGAFTILALEGNPFLLEGWRTLTLPQILESAVVEP